MFRLLVLRWHLITLAQSNIVQYSMNFRCSIAYLLCVVSVQSVHSSLCHCWQSFWGQIGHKVGGGPLCHPDNTYVLTSGPDHQMFLRLSSVPCVNSSVYLCIDHLLLNRVRHVSQAIYINLLQSVFGCIYNVKKWKAIFIQAKCAPSIFCHQHPYSHCDLSRPIHI